MNEATSQLLDMLFSMVIFLFAIAFAIIMFAQGDRYNDMLAERLGVKASSRYSLAYSENHVYVSPEEVYTDIMGGGHAQIELDGAELLYDTLERARSGDAACIRAIRNELTHARYRKVNHYDANGNVDIINFIGE